MKKIFFTTSIICLLLIVAVKFTITNQENQIKIIDQRLNKVSNEIEKLKTDLSYLSSPIQLKKINKKEFGFSPILQDNIIKLDGE